MSIILEQPMLFKRAKTGKIQSYRILTKHDKNSQGFVIVKQTGQLEGKKIEHQEIITQGKNLGKANETSPRDQAIFQMQSDWQKKKDEGYKDLQELNHPNPDLSITAVMGANHVKPLADFLERELPEFNTDSSGNMKPMLAYPIEKVKESSIEFPVFVQPKLDGVRCLAIISSTEIKLLSRGGKFYKVPHVQKELKKFRSALRSPEDTLILDGEIYNHDMEFEDIVSAVKAIKTDTLKLKFCCYDLAGESIFAERWEALEALFKFNSIDSKIVALVPTLIVNSFKTIEDFHEKCISSNYEGAMVRLSSGKYEFGARSRSLLKVKKFDETEYSLIKLDASGHRGVQDIKAVCKGPEGKTFSASMNGTLAHKSQLWTEWQSGKIKKGDLVTVEHFGLTNGDLPRFPKGKIIRNYE